jgi:hypothetical protein
MKKVLILSVIAMLALSVMALASTANAHVLSNNPYGSANLVQAGPTCSSSSLTVYSVIGIEQGFVATATSYDASFCGATGDPLTSAYLSGSLANVLASLSVESNMDSIAVGVSYTLTGPTGNSAVESSDLSGYLTTLTLTSPNGYSGGVLTLAGGSVSTPWSGTLYVKGPSSIQPWVAAGDYKLATTFTITPENTF